MHHPPVEDRNLTLKEHFLKLPLVNMLTQTTPFHDRLQ